MTTTTSTTMVDMPVPSGEGIRKGFRAVMLLLAGLLLIAAGLKAHELATRPVAEVDFLTQRWVRMVLVELEVLFGLWLLTGLYPRPTWAAALAAFTVFTGISFTKALRGAESCGCFGAVTVNPWLTVMLDLAAIGLLLGWHPWKKTVSPAPARPSAQFNLTGYLIAGPIAAAALGFYMTRFESAALAEDGQLIGQESFVILEPEQWRGKAFPLTQYIDVGSQLTQGAWVVLLFHHDCPTCVRALPRYVELARQAEQRTDLPKVALIEMPPYGPASHQALAQSPSLLLGKLNNSREWFVTSPARVDLQDNVVTTAATGESAADAVYPHDLASQPAQKELAKLKTLGYLR